MELTTTNNAWGELTIQVVAGRIQIAVNGVPTYFCSEEQSQQIVQFLRDQFEKAQEAR